MQGRVSGLMEEIVGRWNSLSLTEEEEVVALDDEFLAIDSESFQRGILGKVSTKKPHRKLSFRSAINRMWKVDGCFSIREMENVVFSISLKQRFSVWDRLSLRGQKVFTLSFSSVIVILWGEICRRCVWEF